jgi:hypothetical protein
MARNEHEEPGSLRVYASSPRAFLEDLQSLIAAMSGETPEREPTRVVGRVEVDAFEAHVGATKSIETYDPRPDEPAPDVSVPPKVRDLDRLEIGPEQVAIVRIVPARDRMILRAVAFAALLLALGFLLFLLAL